MNARTSGTVIALASAVGGSLTPSAATAFLGETYFLATGLTVLVLLGACIALLHIKDRSDAIAVGAGSEKPAAQKKPSKPATGVELAETPRNGSNLRRVKAPAMAAQNETPPTAQTA